MRGTGFREVTRSRPADLVDFPAHDGSDRSRWGSAAPAVVAALAAYGSAVAPRNRPMRCWAKYRDDPPAARLLSLDEWAAQVEADADR